MATNPALLSNPLDFMHEGHLRQRGIYEMLDVLATTDTEAAACIQGFLNEELPLHMANESEIDRAIARLCSDRRNAEKDTPMVVTILESIASLGRAVPAEGKATLMRGASNAGRHFILENAIILFLARLRLTLDDLEGLRLRMMQRRGLDQLQGIAPC